MTQVRLMVVDDHEVLRMGLCKLFKGSRTIRVVGQAGNAVDAVMQADRLKPDVVLMDLRLPDASGVEACRRIRSAHPHTRVLFLTSFQDQSALMASTYAGASGFVLKQIAGQQLIRAIETVASGGSFIDSAMTDAIVQQLRASAASGETRRKIVLPSQQRRVLALLAGGQTNRQIAAALSLSEKTVTNYVRIIFQKLRVHSRSQAAVHFVKSEARAESFIE
ncbi:MAG: DNA-binding response regulator [Nitrospira sp.]|nr:MAG: DNA-binding response regulator [Nitrospira sp.]